ncbi:TPA: hypothetical protein R8I30_000001, partial [Campylobacter jejuni]|nr:hypothetical protein [Campylobacter jejuni]EDO7489177.1 hypothetical protein [Campylobacter jejuni]EDO8170856.1 hypothetical protein [Campylobacter jejuni]EDP5494711.1 hypothetical protein [Campylobacter jejuni]EJZ3102872.1 hypothetical protein [Campylobacter jejuni]
MTAHNKLSQANLTESVKHKVVLSKKEINMKDIKNYTDKELKEKIIQDLESEFR